MDCLPKERSGKYSMILVDSAFCSIPGHLKAAGHLHGFDTVPSIVNYAEHLGLRHLF